MYYTIVSLLYSWQDASSPHLYLNMKSWINFVLKGHRRHRFKEQKSERKKREINDIMLQYETIKKQEKTKAYVVNISKNSKIFPTYSKVCC